MSEKSWSFSFGLSPLKAVIDLNGANGPGTKNKTMSTEMMQYYDVVNTVVRRAGCDPAFLIHYMFSVLRSVCFRLEVLDTWSVRFERSGALRCKGFLWGILGVDYVECALSWVICGFGIGNNICHQKVKGKLIGRPWAESNHGQKSVQRLKYG